MIVFSNRCHRRIKMACHALDSVRIEIHSYLYLYQQTWIKTQLDLDSYVYQGRYSSLNPMEQLLLGAPTIHDVDDPLGTFIVALSLISKDFTGGVIVEVGLKKLCKIVHVMFADKTMVSRHQVHFLHQTHWYLTHSPSVIIGDHSSPKSN